MEEFTLTQAQPISGIFQAGPYYEGDDFGTAYINGNFDSGTVTLQASAIDPSAPEFDAAVDWFTVPDISVTEKAMVQPGVKAAFFRWRADGAGGGAGIVVRHLTMARVTGLGS